ncbi:hypothetical protein ABNN70_00615 [Sporolactobacillus sp. Y61]|uniref:Uncharacterized protein n=1 Tax=Sporolactobacillus sp. Y61 TaxID=3160863 RepID=A0AAU8IJS9_9BACL
MHGNAYTRTRWVTYALTTLAVSVFGTKSVDKISKTAKAGKTGEAAGKASTAIKTTRTRGTEWVNQKLDQWRRPLPEGWKVLFVSNQNARLCTFRLHNSVLLFCHTQDIQDSITICNSKTMYCNHLSNDHLGCLN